MTQHTLVTTISHGDPDIGAEVEVKITYTYTPGAAPIIHPADNADPGYPAEVEFVSAVPLVNGKPHAYYGAFADLEQQSLDDLARNWLDDEGYDEAVQNAEDHAGPDPDAARDAAIDDRLTGGDR